MTHSIIYEIRTKDWDKVEEIKDALKDSEEFRELYMLKKTKYCYEQKGGSQPFIWFPDKDQKKDEESEYYTIIIETGSHVAPYDTLLALHWYYFTRAFLNYFSEELKGLKKGYRLDGETEIQDHEWIKEQIGIH